MPSVKIIDENGNEDIREISSRTASIRSDNLGQFSPSVVQNIKYDNKGQMSSITSECGETENRREGDATAKLTIEGIITESEINPMKSLKFQDQITFVTDMEKGNFIVERLSIKQSPDLLYYYPDGGEKELAFEFQLQIKQPE